MKFPTKIVDAFTPRARAPGGIEGGAVAIGHWHIVARDPDGLIIREETFTNLVVNEGLDHLLDVTLSAATQITSWFVGLTDGTPTVAAGDTMASHAGWAEVTNYDEAARPGWTDGGVSAQSVDNSASKATFTIGTGGATIGGAFLASDSTKGGTTGTLYAAGAFSGGDLVLSEGSTLDVTATFTQAAA